MKSNVTLLSESCLAKISSVGTVQSVFVVSAVKTKPITRAMCLLACECMWFVRLIMKCITPSDYIGGPCAIVNTIALTVSVCVELMPLSQKTKPFRAVIQAQVSHSFWRGTEEFWGQKHKFCWGSCLHYYAYRKMIAV